MRLLYLHDKAERLTMDQVFCAFVFALFSRYYVANLYDSFYLYFGHQTISYLLN